MKILPFFILFGCFIAAENPCILNNHHRNRPEYNVGDTISLEDQQLLFPVCYGDYPY